MHLILITIHSINGEHDTLFEQDVTIDALKHYFVYTESVDTATLVCQCFFILIARISTWHNMQCIFMYKSMLNHTSPSFLRPTWGLLIKCLEGMR